MWGDPAAQEILAEWATKYGPVLYRSGPFGTGDLSIADLRAVAHIYNHSEVRGPFCLFDDERTEAPMIMQKVYHVHALVRANLHSVVRISTWRSFQSAHID
jgi:hypothetical protein